MEEIKNISILGSTSWGITLANILVQNVDNVTILVRDFEEEKKINDERLINRGKIYKLHNKIKISSNYETIIQDSQFIILAVPSVSIKKNIDKINKFLTNKKIVISAIKGFENESKKTISQYLIDKTSLEQNNIGVISGPNISSEIYDGLPATTVIGINKIYEEKIREVFNTDNFRAYSSNDIIGIETGGILKNIFAIGAGIIQEYKLGTNAMASYITRSLNEIKNISKYFGAEENTIFGNSGLGDLITTCFNHNSRNNQLGTLIAKGNNLITAQEKILGVVEGINSTKIMNEILTQNKIEAPIIYEIYKVLFESKNPKIGIEDLMKRDYSKE